MVAAEIGTGATRGAPAEHRAGDQPVVTGLQLAGGQLLQAGAQTGTQQTRLVDHRTGQGDHALGPQLAAGEQLADGDDVLIVDGPHTLGRTDRIEVVDMGPDQTRRMRAGEGLGGHPGQALAGQADALGLAQEHLGQTTEHLETTLEVGRMLGDDHRRIGSERIGVDGADEDRAGRRVDRGHLAVRTGPQGGPQAGVQQVLAYLAGIEAGQLGGRIAGEGELLVAFEVNDHRLQDTLFATMNGAHHTGGRRSKVHPRSLLVGKQDLAELHSITDLHLHRGLHPVIIEANDGDTAYRPCGLYTLRRRACYGQIKPMFQFDHRFA
ncbi:hypothetical protein D3C80_1036800 [compost metagenome]